MSLKSLFSIHFLFYSSLSICKRSKFFNCVLEHENLMNSRIQIGKWKYFSVRTHSNVKNASNPLVFFLILSRFRLQLRIWYYKTLWIIFNLLQESNYFYCWTFSRREKDSMKQNKQKHKHLFEVINKQTKNKERGEK